MTNLFEGLFKAREAEPAESEKLVELDWGDVSHNEDMVFKTVAIEKYADVDNVLESMRDKKSIILMKIRTRMTTDKTELRRAIRRVQKSCYAMGGDLIGLSEEMILVTPPGVVIERDKESAEQVAAVKQKFKAET